MRKITKLRHSIKAISPIISVLLLIAIAVVASLVVYAWVMGYIGGGTTKAGYAIDIQSLSSASGSLTIYVQNTGIGAVQLNTASAVYVNDTLVPITSVTPTGDLSSNGQIVTIAQGQTAALVVPWSSSGPVTIKVVTTSGTFMTTTGTSYAGGTSYSVTFAESGGGGSSTISPSGTASYTGPVQISATVGSGYTFSGWSATGSITFADATSASTTATVNGAGTVTATFTQTDYQVSFTTSGGGSGSTISPSTSGSYTAGQPVTIKATVGSGYTFSGWSATGSITFADATSASTTATVNGAGTVTATFTQITYQVVFGTSGTGTTSPSGTQNIPAGPVSIVATAGTNYQFSGWSATGSITFADATSASTTATVNGAGTVTATFVVAHILTSITISPTPATIAVGGSQIYTATGYDQNGVSMGDVTSSATFSVNGASIARNSVTEPSDGIYSVTASIGSVTSNTATLTVYGPLASFSVSPISASQIAGTAFTVTITAQDANGFTVANYAGSATLTDFSGSIGPISTGAFTNGVWTGQVTITKAWTNDVITVADSSSSAAGQSGLFTVNPGALATFAFSAISSPQIAGTSFSVTITAQDAYGNTITTYTGPATLTDLSGSVSPASATFTAGVWTSQVTVTKAWTNDVITVADSSSSATGQSGQFNVNPGALASFAFGTISSPQIAGTSFPVTITAQDAYGNTVTSYTGPATFSDLSNSITLSNTGSFTNGVYIGSVTITAAYTGDIITATDSGTLKTGQSNAFTVSGAAATQLVYTVGASQILPINTVSSVITVQLQDQYGNPVNAGTGGVTVTLTSNPATTATFYSNPTTKITTTPITITIPAGSSSASFYFSDSQYESPTLTAAATGVTGVTSAVTTFTVTQYQLIFVPNTATEPVGQGITEIQVQRETTGGAHYGGTAITVQLSTSSATGYFATLANGVYTKITQITVSNGFYYGQNYFYYIDTTAGTPTLTAATPGYTSGTAQFTIYSPTLSGFNITASSGGNIGTQATGEAFNIKITAVDQYGNAVTSYTGTNTLTASIGAISPTTTGSFVAGVWTGSVTLNTAGTISISTNDGNGHPGTSNTFTVYAPTLKDFTFTATGGYGGNIGTQAAGTAFSITITAYDQDGNVLTSYAGPYTLTDTSGSLTYTGSFNAGVLTASVTITKATTTDVITIKDTASGINAASNQFTVNHSATIAGITVAPSSASIAAGNTETYTATATDSYGNTWSVTTSVTWSITSGAGGSWSYYPGDNVYTSATAGTWTVTATDGTAKGTASLTVTAGTLSQFAITANGGGNIGTQTAGTAFNVVITAQDQYGNTVTSYAGPNTLTISTGTISPTSTGAFTAGVCTVSITLTKAGSFISISTSGSGKSGTSNTFTVNPGALYQFVFSTIGTTQTSGHAFTVASITAEDQDGNTITSLSGTETLAVTSGTITSSTSITFRDGVASEVSVTITLSPSSSVQLYITGYQNKQYSNAFTV